MALNGQEHGNPEAKTKARLEAEVRVRAVAKVKARPEAEAVVPKEGIRHLKGRKRAAVNVVRPGPEV